MTYFLAMLVITQALSVAYIIKLKQQVKAPVPTKELSEFVRDLARGSALVAIRVDAENLILRSPRG
jgi:hypothetical protein